MRRALAAGALVLVALASAGCAPSPITAGRIEASVATTFANLWVLHEAEVGHPHPAAATLHSHASCRKGLPSQAQNGPGNDWVCYVTWLVDGPGTPVTATYNLDVQTDGCYSADGDGPVSVNGSATIVDSRGVDRVNPLWAFNGCFDTT